MEVKKQRLLFMLHPTEGEGEEQVGVAGTADEEEKEDSGEVVGMKCRAPLKEVGKLLSFLCPLMMADVSLSCSHGVQSTTTILWCSALNRKKKEKTVK